MKKLLLVLLSAFAITVQAKENITIYYGWNASDVAANFHRTLAAEANKQQNKYNFIFDVKPGAGAAIAAMYVAKTPDTILATSSAFWIRPNFFPAESHRVDDFRELMPQCAAPLTLVSGKYKSFSEIPKDKPLTVAVSGLGITTHLVATEIAKKYPNMTVIPFKSTAEGVISVLGGQTDFGVNFVGDSEQYTLPTSKTRLYMLGVTGTESVLGAKTFASQGFDRITDSLNAPAHLAIPITWSDTKFKEVRGILVKAARSQAVLDSYKPDHCQSLNQMSDEQLQPWFNAQNARWKRIASGITLK